MHSVGGRHNAIRRKDTTDLLCSYIDRRQNERRSSWVVKTTPDGENVSVLYKRTQSNPTLSESIAHRLERRRSAVTFPNTYKSLYSPPAKSVHSRQHFSVSSVSDPDVCCYGAKSQRQKKSHYSSGDDGCWLSIDFTPSQLRIRKSLEYVEINSVSFSPQFFALLSQWFSKWSMFEN